MGFALEPPHYGGRDRGLLAARLEVSDVLSQGGWGWGLEPRHCEDVGGAVDRFVSPVARKAMA